MIDLYAPDALAHTASASREDVIKGNYKQFKNSITHCLGDNIQYISTSLGIMEEMQDDALFHYCSSGPTVRTREKLFYLIDWKQYKYKLADQVYQHGQKLNLKKPVAQKKVESKFPYVRIDHEKIEEIDIPKDKYICYHLVTNPYNPNQFSKDQFAKMFSDMEELDMPMIMIPNDCTLGQVAYIMKNAELCFFGDNGLSHFNQMIGETKSIIYWDGKLKNPTKHVQGMIDRGCDVEIKKV